MFCACLRTGMYIGVRTRCAAACRVVCLQLYFESPNARRKGQAAGQRNCSSSLTFIRPLRHNGTILRLPFALQILSPELWKASPCGVSAFGSKCQNAERVLQHGLVVQARTCHDALAPSLPVPDGSIVLKSCRPLMVGNISTFFLGH